MASYGLKYWWQKDRDGVAVRLEIQQRGYSGTAKEIYALQSLSLELQGGDDAIDSPIIKTSLNVGLIDASDMPDTTTMKYGDWTEFFTPDSTLYRFVLKQGGTTRWTGYLTPDSYEEDLTYRSTISVTARDNIGHLKDFDFPREVWESVSVMEMIDTALDLIEFPMTVVQSLGMRMTDVRGNTVTSLSNVYTDPRTFWGSDWYSVIEGLLDSLGLAFRFIDNNRFLLAPLRYVPDMGSSLPARKSIVFLNSSGHRMLEPAVKQILEEMTYDKEDAIYVDLDESCFEPATVTIEGNSVQTFKTVNCPWRVSGNIGCLDNFQCRYSAGDEVDGSLNSSDTLYIHVFPAGISWRSNYFYASCTLREGAAVTFSFQLKSRYLVSINSNVKEYSEKTAEVVMHFVVLHSEQNTGTRYYDGNGWTSTFTVLTATVSKNEGIKDFSYSLIAPFYGTMGVEVHGFHVNDSALDLEALMKGEVYAGVSGLKVSAEDVDGYESRKTTTVMSDTGNVTINRSPLVGQVPTVASVDVFVNGIYSNKVLNPPVTGWAWSDREQEGDMPLAMVVHKQILMYHSRTSNILNGTLMDATLGDPRFDDIYTWRGIDFLLTGGSLDMLTGYINNATLRDFVRYEDLWMTEDTLKFDKDSIAVPANGGSVSIGVISNLNWNAVAQIGGSSIQVSPVNGSGNGTLVIAVPANGECESREGYVRLACTDIDVDVDNVVCPIIQEAGEIVLSVSSLSVEADSLGGSYWVDVDTNYDGWTVSTSDSWLSVNRPNGTTAHIVVENNDGRDSVQRTGSVKITAGDKVVTVSVNQPSGEGLQISLNSDDYEITSAGGVASIVGVTNAKYISVTLLGYLKFTHAELFYVVDNSDPILLAENDNPGFGVILDKIAVPNDPGADRLFTIGLNLTAAETEETEDKTTAVSISAWNDSDGKSEIVSVKQTAVGYGINTEPASLSFNSTGGSQILNVDSNVAWNAYASDGFFSLSVSSGSAGVTAVTVTCQSHEDVNNGRTGTIMFRSSDHLYEKTVQVTQGVATTELTISPTQMSFNADGQASGTNMLTIQSNTSYKLNKSADYITTSVTHGENYGRVAIGMTKNSTLSQRTGTVTVTTDNGKATRTLNLTQSATSVSLSLNPSSLTLDSLGNGGHVVVTTNASSWTVQSQSSWLSVTRESAGFFVKPDSGNSGRGDTPRTGSVLVQAGGEQAVLQVTQEGQGLILQTLADEFEVPAEGGKVQIAIVTNTSRFNIITSLVGHKTLYMLDEGDVGDILAETESISFSPAVTIPGDPGAEGMFGLMLEIDVSVNTGSKEISYSMQLTTLDGVTKVVTIVQAAAAPEDDIVMTPSGKMVPYYGERFSVAVDAPGEWSAAVNEYGKGWVEVTRISSKSEMEVDVDTQPLGRETSLRSCAVIVTSGSLSKSFSIIQSAPGVIINLSSDNYDVPSSGGDIEIVFASNAKEIGIDASAYPSAAKRLTVMAAVVPNNTETVLEEMIMSYGLFDIPGDPGMTGAYMGSLSFFVPAGTGSKTITITGEEDGSVKITKVITINQS